LKKIEYCHHFDLCEIVLARPYQTHPSAIRTPRVPVQLEVA
jgi:hypothetical protein